MQPEANNPLSSLFKAVTSALGQTWLEPVMQLIGRVLMGRSAGGIYEVQNYQCTLEVKDREGSLATVQKCERVRYLQDYIAAFQDQAWGDGSFLLNYKCSPGVPVDEYKLGHNTIKLISLRGLRNQGDIDEFNIEWSMKNGFRKSTGFWGTSINHRTHKAQVRIIFPKNRPPLEVSIYERNSQ